MATRQSHPNSKKEKLRYTSSQRRVESLSQRNSIILETEKKKNEITEQETFVSDHNSKTVNYQKFKEYIKEKNILNKHTSDFYDKLVWRKMKFRTYSYTQRSEAKLLNNIEKIFGKPEDIVLAYGNWQEKKQMKHFHSTPGIGLRKTISKKFLTITVDEYKTSQNCCKCHKKVKLATLREKERYRLLECEECVSYKSEKSVLITRDLNSALNMGLIMKEWIEKGERPVEYRRNAKITTS